MGNLIVKCKAVVYAHVTITVNCGWTNTQFDNDENIVKNYQPLRFSSVDARA